MEPNEAPMIKVDDKIEEIFLALSEALRTKVEFASGGEGQPIKPYFDINALISKIVALMVYSGMTVPSSFAPAFNRVHADVEFWKKEFEKNKESAPKKEESNIQPESQV